MRTFDPKRFRPWMLAALGVTVAAYAAAVGVLYARQRAMVFLPDRSFHGAAALNLTGYRDVVIGTGDGERLVALYRPAERGRPTVLYFHGNRGSMPRLARRLRALAEEGFGVLAPSYRGYSGSTGSPTEEGLAEDARSAFDWLDRTAPGANVVVYGESLGSGVAVRLATERTFSAVVLDAPYTSLPDVAAERYPLVPVHWLMKDRFPSAARIAGIDRPLLIVHGDADGTVPFRFGERLHAQARDPKRFVRIPGGNHVDNMEAAWDEVRSFVAGAGAALARN
jgi:fermentation-respiration switch protein FrsA (DUF1100 family)